LNNPLIYSDPSGDFIIPAMIAGMFVNTAIQLLTGNVNDIGDFFFAMGIGALSGATADVLGSALSQAAMYTSGFKGGIISGSFSGSAGGFIGGAGNAWTNGANFNEGIMSGMKGAVYGAVSGGIINGMITGISAVSKGYTFINGEKVTAMNDIPVTIEGEYTGFMDSWDLTNFAYDNFDRCINYVQSVSCGNELPNYFPSGYTVIDDEIYQLPGLEPIAGLTKSFYGQAKSLIWISSRYKDYTGDLIPVLGHEIIHAFHNYIGFYNTYNKDASEYLCYRYSALTLPNRCPNWAVTCMNEYLRNLVKIPYPYSSFYPPWVPARIK